MAGRIRALIFLFQTAFEQLHCQIPPLEIEALAVLIHRGMTAKGRRFHTSEHILGLADPDHPEVTLAALFHDLVYYQVDLGVAPSIRALLAPYVEERAQRLWLKPQHESTDDRFVAMVLELFGFTYGQELHPRQGMNEFLSALAMGLRLKAYLPCETLLAIATCIEATIPFRPHEHFEELTQRLQAIVTRYQLQLSPANLEAIVTRSVIFANHDVENFAVPDPRAFLENTWKLLPEEHNALRAGGIYTIKEYRRALQATAEFFQTLDITRVFHRYRGVPPLEQWEQMTSIAQANVQIAQSYLEIKLLTISILEALADATGGDMPLALVMGDLEDEAHSLMQLIEFPDLQFQTLSSEQRLMLLKLLGNGLKSADGFDLQNSPLSLFIYQVLGPEATHTLSLQVWRYFRGELQATDFLEHIPRAILSPIARACAIMIPTRREACLRFT